MARKRKRTRKNPQSASAQAIKIIFFLLISFMASLSLIGDFTTIVPDIPEYGNNQGTGFIATVAPAAQQMQATYGVHASISIAQAILESDWGESELSAVYNNLYGMKGDDPGNTVLLTTNEYYNGQWVTIQANFRVYGSWTESVQDHALLFVNGTTWNPSQYAPVLQATTYQEAAQALQDCGYATDPDYATKLIAVIEQHALYEYDS
ncbi:flagellum-specific peptidoglycan hydrolase FlgJ [Trichococcus patagoniensis]|uniref:Flagellum-specific peptidoglycan hydrolase FlgJ n=1 Tax=Trichococcus patagoniensis TaxID=382641 RepID=A0A2T5IMC9_9LACT|nr:glycoside hydrolase family 73 protein [Trichococcus patagoniensis]PTQ84973.1 flagellum-specific peptidoglycan hydrolase FlgJ [Trichococcus patagoniensis]